MKKGKITSILVVHDQAKLLEGVLEKALPSLEIYYAQTSDEISQALVNYNPEVIFAINSRQFQSNSLHDAAHYSSVKWFHVGGSGIDHILPWLSETTVLSNGAGVLSRYLAETVLGAMLAMNNNLHLYKSQQLERNWLQHGFKPLSEQTLLIVGLGAIGERVADNAKALGMKVIATRRKNIAYKNVDILYSDKQLEAVIPEADFVTLHIPYSVENHDLFDQQMFNRMKQGACFINTARGGLVDEIALSQVLSTKYLKAAFLDVFKQEPLPVESQLWALDNLFISPHMADSVHGFERRYLDFFVENVQRWNKGEVIKNQLK